MTARRAQPGTRARARALLPFALGSFLLAGVVLAPAMAADAARPAPTLRITARPAAHQPAVIEVLARLSKPAAPAGSKQASLSGVTISFSVHVQQFSGAPLLALGSATTNARGEATFSYRPTWTGAQDLAASATNSAGDEIASAATSVIATTATRPLAASAEAVRPDGTIGQVVVGVLLAILALLWIVLVSVVVRVHRGVAPAAR